MNADFGRIAAATCILVTSAVVVHLACLRSSTIYFFELDSSRVLFISKRHAFIFPLILSALLTIVYYATKRSRELETIRDLEEKRRVAQETKELTAASRKVSRSVSELRPIFEASDNGEEQELLQSAARLRRMLSDIEERQEGRVRDRDSTDVEEGGEKQTGGENVVDEETGGEKAEGLEPGKIIHPHDDEESLSEFRRSLVGIDEEADDYDLDEAANEPTTSRRWGARRTSSEPPEDFTSSRSLLGPPSGALIPLSSEPGSRKSSIGSRTGLIRATSRKNSVNLSDEPTACELYKELGKIDLMTYLVNAVSIFPERDSGTVKKTIRLSDLFADLMAVHVPVWACVAALHVVLLELITHKFAFYFYYHEETMAYAALIASIVFGLVHEFIGNWATNDVLALSSVYVVVSRVQLVSFQTGVVLTVGLICFDLFWLYVVDLLSTVTGQTHAPFMISVPRDNEGAKQSIATLDVMAPGVFLTLLLKFNAMYDPKLYGPSFYAAFAGLAATMGISIWRQKITPALILPLLAVLAASLAVVDRPYDLWRFMIKH